MVCDDERETLNDIPERSPLLPGFFILPLPPPLPQVNQKFKGNYHPMQSVASTTFSQLPVQPEKLDHYTTPAKKSPCLLGYCESPTTDNSRGN